MTDVGLSNEAEAEAARWRVLLNDPEFMEAAMRGIPDKRMRDREPGECPVRYMLTVCFPVVRLH